MSIRQILPVYLSGLLFLSLLISGCSEPQNTDMSQEAFAHPDWSYNATIYELNTRQFTAEGTFKAAQQRLDKLEELGVKIIWFMPIQPIGEKNRKGKLGSYYSIKDYTAINPEFGNMEDFKDFVDAAHQRGMYVILDWVANHTAWDHHWTKEHPEYYNKDEDGNFQPPVEDWTDVIDLNYENEDLRKEMRNSMKFWVQEADIDGFRCDVASMVPTDFWNNTRKELDKIKPVFMLAEAEKPEHHEKAFDMSYGWSTHSMMNEIAAGNKEAYHLDSLLMVNRTRFPYHAFRMQFTSNHDENSWNGTVFERMGEGAKAFAVLTATMEGMPLVYNGQETGMKKRLEFFERDPINWKDDSEFRNFYTKLLHLKRNNDALLNGTRGAPMDKLAVSDTTNIYAFHRSGNGDKVVVFLNMSDDKLMVQVNDQDLAGSYRRLFTEEDVSLTTKDRMNLNPWEYRVYVASE